MADTVVLIRCRVVDQRVRDLAEQIKRCSNFEVFATVDCYNSTTEEAEESKSDPETLVLTSRALEDLRLVKSPDGKTGWLCGDYVSYLALPKSWDRVWIVEPDVFFLNGAEKLLTEMDRIDADLLCTNYRRTGTGWYWAKILQTYFPELAPYGMSFPLVRMSRDLVEACLAMRQQMQAKQPSGPIPNDEVVVATCAGNQGFSTVSLNYLLPDYFQYWGAMVRHCVPDLQVTESRPLIVHSGRSEGHYLKNMRFFFEQATDGSERAFNQLRNSLKSASKETLTQLLLMLASPDSKK